MSNAEVNHAASPVNGAEAAGSDDQKLIAKQKKDARDAKKQAKLEKFQQKQAVAASQPPADVSLSFLKFFYAGIIVTKILFFRKNQRRKRRKSLEKKLSLMTFRPRKEKRKVQLCAKVVPPLGFSC